MQLSISIVSLNNPQFLFRCLQSVYQFSHGFTFEVIVVACEFSAEKLQTLREEFPSVCVIESYGVRGFSENQNLALRQAKGEYCLILNDDTYFDDNSIRILLNTFRIQFDAALVSPVILNPDGSVQLFGRPRYNIWYFVFEQVKLHRVLEQMYRKAISVRYLHTSIVPTYEVSGSCFMVKTSVLRDLGYFDEYYFFTPEDVALSTKARLNGFRVYVNKSSHVYHFGSTTAAPRRREIIPVCMQGLYHYYETNYGLFASCLARLTSAITSILKIAYWYFNGKGVRAEIMKDAYKYALKFSFRSIPPKELIVKLSTKRGKAVGA
jgi:N-acetylglucosaminyl-diphospho-decaprenol L-rhamnosyltransferase